MVSTRVMNKFAGAQVGDKDMVETYMEEVAKVLALAEYSGARQRAGQGTVFGRVVAQPPS